MYEAILHAHNATRWLILLLGVAALVRAAQGLGGERPYAAARRVGVFFTAALHLQLLLGIALFVVSPFIKTAMGDMRATMHDAAVRFFVAEHPTFMVAATILMTIGGLIAKNAPNDAAKHRKAMIFIALTLALILIGIPWKRALI